MLDFRGIEISLAEVLSSGSGATRAVATKQTLFDPPFLICLL